jgi:hypothetical protein
VRALRFGSARLPVEELVRIPLSYPTYTGILVRAAYRAAEQLEPGGRWIPA